ncbi:hypothetical protein Tco_0875262 [Tanacetum coccineum]|uniref:Reverse transcriptase domain-containing protein n=1 Tax=Tanacetum coccineum TaxID=301880 RepID=A0ABQ5BPA8_9ASTR
MDAPLSNSSSSNNSFDMQQIAASLEDKMTIKMNQMLNQMKALVVTTPAPVKAVEEVCVTCGSNHSFNLCPLTRGGNDFPVFHDNIQQFQQTAAVGNFLQRNQPFNLASQMRPPGFNQPNVQTNQNRYQGTNSNFNQNRGGNYNQNRPNNQTQNQVYQAPPYQTPTNQPQINQVLPHQPPTNSVSKTEFENYSKANDANMNNLQMKLDNFQNDFQRVYNESQKKQDDFQKMMLGFMQNYHTNQPSSSSSLPSNTIPNPRNEAKAEPSIPLVPTPDVSKPQKEPEQNPETSTEKVQNPNLENTAHVPSPGEEDSIFMEIPKPKAKKTVNLDPNPNSYPSKLPYPERMKIGLKDALVEMPKFNKWLSSLLRNKEKLEEIAITTVNAECSAIIMNKVPEKLEDPGKFLIPSLTPTRMTLELANRPFPPLGQIAEDVVVRVDGFTFLADFVEKNYADKSEKNKEKNFVHAISIIDFSKDDPFSGSTTNNPPPSSSPMKTSDNFKKFTDEFAPLDSLPPGKDDLTLKKDLHEVNFQDYSNPLYSNVSDEPVFLNTPLSDKDECFAPEDDNDEIDDFLAMEVSSNLEEGYFDSEGDIAFLDNLLSDDDSHNLDSKVTSDHEPEQNESSITFSPRSDPLHHEFAGEPLTLPARNDREFEEYLSLMTVLNEISTSQGNFHQNSVNMSLPISPIPVEDSEPTQEEIDILLVPDDLIPPGVEDADSEDEVNESPNLDHQNDPSIPRPPPEPPDIKKCFEPKTGILIIKEFKGVSKSHDFMTSILPTLVSDLPFISSIVSFENEDTIFDPGIVTFLRAGGIF